ncbi:MAG TPA: protein kinase [Bryobacteraceae bacterium]|jgi:serine/threonine-protein kinase
MHPVDEPFKLREVWPSGTVIKGDYTVEKRLGSGGFGTVYLARHRFLGTMHVIKRLHEQFASDPEYVRKFMNEGRAIRRLKACPNIVEVEHMTQSEDGHLILVMEHIPGGDLSGMMETRRLSIPEVIEYGRQIAVALEAAHQSGLIHRDIKPQNILISQDSTGKTLLKLIDFGIAADQAGHQTTSVMRGGSIGFAAPEQWVKAGKELDGRADLYALGATMYRMLTGQMPYPDVYDIGGWIECVKQGPPVAPARLRADVPEPLSALILDMLALRPEARPADARTVATRLSTMQTVVESPHIATLQMKRDLTEAITPVPAFATAPPAGPSGNAWIKIGAGGLTTAVLLLGFWKLSEVTDPAKPAAVPAAVTQPAEQPKIDPPKKPAARIPDRVKEKPKPAETATVKSATPPPIKAPEPEPPPVDHAALGDKARDAGDFRGALPHYKTLGDNTRLATLQKAVEGDTEERSSAMTDHGRYGDALTLVDGWLRDFPGSQRLQRLRAKIIRARDSQ